MCEVIAIVNQKGGCAKTTTAVNLGIGLAQAGKKVAVVDADPQASLTVSLGYRDPDMFETTLATIMESVINGEDINPEQGILHHEEGIDLVPSNIRLAGIEVSLSSVMSREMILKDYISLISDRYDYILIDCMPSLGLLTVNSLVAVSMVRKRLNRNLRILGILITMADFRTNCTRDIVSKLKEAYGNSIGVFETSIPASVKAVEASAEGSGIFTHDPNGKATKAFQRLTEEVLSR